MPAADWQGVRDATQFAPHCAQPALPLGQGSTSEDCLYLNVYVPPGVRLQATPTRSWCGFTVAPS
jgi:carboxylesterase type B